MTDPIDYSVNYPLVAAFIDLVCDAHHASACADQYDLRSEDPTSVAEFNERQRDALEEFESLILYAVNHQIELAHQLRAAFKPVEPS